MGYTHYVTVKRDLGPRKWARFQEVNRRLLASLPKTVPNHYSAPFRRNAADELEAVDGYQEMLPLTLRGPYGKGEPELDNEHITFNGDANLRITGIWTSQGSHEDFAIWREGGQDTFCKTAQKPYDLAVCVVLLNLVHELTTSVYVYSDGEAPQWQDAVNLYETVTERHAPSIITNADGYGVLVPYAEG